MNIYVASSWRNDFQEELVRLLRGHGYTVYDFKNPAPGDHGFSWRQIDPDYRTKGPWLAEQFRDALKHPIAEHGFGLDMKALETCDVCLLVLPCGRSAHLELGWAAGWAAAMRHIGGIFSRVHRKYTIALMMDSVGGPHEPELMYKMLDHICVNIDEVYAALRQIQTALPNVRSSVG